MSEDETDTTDGTDDRLPQPTEEVHLPDPSYLPVIVAFGTMATLVGIVMWWPVAVIGGVITLSAIVRWIGQAREEMSQLPLEH